MDEIEARICRRQRRVVHLYDLLLSVSDIARLLHVSRWTINNDFKALELENYSTVDHDVLKACVADVINASYPSFGRRFIAAGLWEEFGLRVQKSRILQCKRELVAESGGVFCTQHRIRRLKYYVSPGPHFCFHLDQNEHLVGFRIYLLTAIDGFCRHSMYHQVVTDLTGTTHTRFFTNLVRSKRRLPQHLCVDGTACWNAAKYAMETVFADEPETVVLHVEHNSHTDIPLYIDRAQVVSSVHNSAVEIHWRWTNKIAEEYLECFLDLEALQLLRGGRYPDYIDLFCLHYVFLPYFRRDVERFYAILGSRRKETCTRNPYFPRGTWIPRQLEELYASCGIPLSDEQIDTICGIAESYEWPDGVIPRDHEFTSIPDPLPSDELRTIRDNEMEIKFPQLERPRERNLDYLSDMYVYLREMTLMMLG